VPQQLIEVAPGRFKPVRVLTPSDRKRAARIANRKAAIGERRDELLRRIGDELGEDGLAEIPAEDLPLTAYSLELGEIPMTATLTEVEKELETLERIAAEFDQETNE
jgi:hypothetical protein